MLLRVPGVLSSKLHAKGSPESIRGAINAPTKGTRGGCFTHSSYRCVTEHPGWRVYDFRKFKMPLRVPGVQSSKPQAKYAYKGHLGCYPQSSMPKATNALTKPKMLLRVPAILKAPRQRLINAPTKDKCFTHSSYRCVTEHPGWRVYDFRKLKMLLRVPGVLSSKPQAKCAYKGHLGCYPKSPTPNALAKGTQGGEFMISASSRCSCEHPRCYPKSPTPNALTKDTLGAILKAPGQMCLQRAPRVASL